MHCAGRVESWAETAERLLVAVVEVDGFEEVDFGGREATEDVVAKVRLDVRLPDAGLLGAEVIELALPDAVGIRAAVVVAVLDAVFPDAVVAKAAVVTAVLDAVFPDAVVTKAAVVNAVLDAIVPDAVLVDAVPRTNWVVLDAVLTDVGTPEIEVCEAVG